MIRSAFFHAVRQRMREMDLTPRITGVVTTADDLLLQAHGLDCPTGTAVRVARKGLSPIHGEVVGFDRGHSKVALLSAPEGVMPGARIELLGKTTDVDCGDALCGRAVDAQGCVIDGAGPIDCDSRRPLSGIVGNPLSRARVTRSMATGVRAIDALLTMGIGQRIAVIAQPGVGKTVLTSQILDGAEYDIAVVALVGERTREIADFVARRRQTNGWGQTCIVAAAADNAPLLRIRAAMRATAIAEHFRAQGRKVLLIIDSLTRVANAQREIGLALGEPPTMRGYPPSTFSLIPRLVERAGGDVDTGGAITAIYTVLTDGQRDEDPVAESVRSIADGHIVLSRRLAEQGVFPAIDVSSSLSRVMDDIADTDHCEAARNFRALRAAHDANHDLALMGAYVSGTDPLIDTAFERHKDMIEFVRQPYGKSVSFDDARSALIDGFSK